MDSMPDPKEMLGMATAKAVQMLMAVKVSFERLGLYLDAHGVEGTYMGGDIYEVVQGVHDSVSAAIGFLLPPEEEEAVRAKVFGADDAEFERLCAEVEKRGCGHA